MKNTTSKLLLGFIAGAAVGAIAGILLAPDKGSVTRKKIAEKANKFKEALEKDISGKIDDLNEYFTESTEEIKSKNHKATRKSEQPENKSKRTE